ncbi:unnamed protein product [Staurois parvus]|uniref:Uncharacterized protein n=1 Tax=Staurois parvus TaxID=386267 RepID=A0ABN9HPU3_9NEOB|nr:unnamed protein product [Staurois parvus]
MDRLGSVRRSQAGKVSNVRGSEVPEEQAENSQGHKPGSVTHGQRGTEDQAEGWSGKPGRSQDTRHRGSWETYTKALTAGLAIP